MPLSINKKKYISSLQQKKIRKREQMFVVEGGKSVIELLSSDFQIKTILSTPEFYREHEKQLLSLKVEIEDVSEEELVAVGSLQSNNAALAVAAMKANTPPTIRPDQYAVVLDDIRDPGNVGTIIRTADWYGINIIIASEETAEFYNSKTISATMGSFTRVHIFYVDLPAFLSTTPLKKYGAFLGGADVHAEAFAEGGLVVIGNESNGISKDVENLIDQKITIPRYGKAESLNAALSAAIILDNIVRSNK